MAQYTLNFIEQDFTILFLLLFKRGVVLAVFVVEFPGVLVQMVAWGLKNADFTKCTNTCDLEQLFLKLVLCTTQNELHLDDNV